MARKKRKSTVEPGSRGLTPGQVLGPKTPAAVERLAGEVAADGGRVLAAYRDPLGGEWQLLCVLPLEQVKPTPYQRDLSDTHADRLRDRIEQVGRFLDPIVAHRKGPREYWTPNGFHRTEAMRRLGARAIAALVLPDEAIAYKILALNTEKAHNLRERALEVIRMARALAELDPRPERSFALEFEEPWLLTLGLCYEKRGRFSGGAYQPVLRRVDVFLPHGLPRALEVRGERAARLLELDDVVTQRVQELKARGFESPYLRAFVVARLNPLRFRRGARGDYDETLARMLQRARRLDPTKIREEELARAAGTAAEE